MYFIVIISYQKGIRSHYLAKLQKNAHILPIISTFY